MKNMLIIYHSQSGNTLKLVDWCKVGILREEAINLRTIHAPDVTFEDVINADGILLATPENFGTMSGLLKDFFERTYYPAREFQLNKPYALLISCETDGSGTDRQIHAIATGYVLRKTIETLIIRQHEQHEKKAVVIEFGQTFAAGIVLGIF